MKTIKTETQTVNLYYDNCRPAAFARDWIPSRTLACIKIFDYDNYDDYVKRGLSQKPARHYHRSIRLGYTTTVDQYDYRNERLREIQEINESKPIRQGREMDKSYKSPYKIYPMTFCDRHHFVLLLCIDPIGKIVGYMEFYIVGEFAQTSRLLGHSYDLRNGIMNQIFVAAFKVCKVRGVRIFCYAEWESGTEGLKY